MHYMGMWALDVPGHISWSPGLVIASVAIGAIFGIAALQVAAQCNTVLSIGLATLLLTLAIVGHHFTAMGAAEIIPDPAVLVTASSLSPPSLSIAIASAAVAVLGISLVAAAAGSSRQQLIASSEAELAKQAERLQGALANMCQGLCMFDRHQRVV